MHKVVLIGSFPLSSTPEIQSMVVGLDSGAFDRLIEIVDGIGAKVQRELERHFVSNGSVVVLNLKATSNRLEPLLLWMRCTPAARRVVSWRN